MGAEDSKDPDLSGLSRFWFWHYTPQPGDVIVDAGAGRGENLADMHATGAWIVAIEAHPEQFAALIKVAEAYPRVTCIHAALLDCKREVGITTGERWIDNSIVIDGTGVQAIPLDSLQLERVDLLKLNIEGSESLALDGMRDTLKRTRFVVICTHDFRADNGESENFRTHDSVVSKLQHHGFCTETRWTHVHAWR